MSEQGVPSQRIQGKVFNDCVHGHIELPPLCVTIIDTHIFQRLRNIKQLGFSYFVYPGASHNRFEHSLGVCYLAGLLVDELNRNSTDSEAFITQEEKLCLQVAGLCHDLGHGPFSHTWERVLHRAGVKWAHEDMSIKLLEQVFKVDSVKKEFKNSGLTEENKTMIENMIEGKKGERRSFLYEIISNKDTGIDVDKWDYLLRDGQQLNIKVTFDPFRLLKCQRIIPIKTDEDQKQYQICYRDKDQANIWHMYMMRAELHRMAYQHLVVKLIEEMFIDTILLLQDFQFCGENILKVQDAAEKFIYLTDDVFNDILRYVTKGDVHSGNYEASKLLHRILNRNLYALVERKKLSADEKRAKSCIEHIQNFLTEKKEEFNKTNTQPLDLHVTVLNWSMQDLQKSVFIYTKSNLRKANVTDDWTSVPFYKGQINHTEVIFFCKNEESKSKIDELKKIASDIVDKCVKIHWGNQEIQTNLVNI